ncbi:MAG: DUF1800 domain-containing protein [Vicinamibacterales bacterium]
MTRRIYALLLGLAAVAATAGAPQAAKPASDERTALHVLNRITFGPRPGDVARVQQMGVDRFIDEQLHPERLPDSPMQDRLASLDTLVMSSRDIAERFEIPAMQAQLARQQQAGRASTEPAKPAVDQAQQLRANLPMLELSQQRVLRAVYSDRQLEEVLTDFWFNHFNVDARKGPTRYMLTEYERDVIRPHVLGHFRDLLGATAKSPAMLFYLDNWMSADPNGPHPDRARADAAGLGARLRERRDQLGARPQVRPRVQAPAPNGNAALRRPTGLNENYGRELLELHTLGVDGGYTQKDVTEVARAFTGWTIQNPRLGGGYRFAANLHDDGEKRVLGHVIPAGGGERDGEDVLDIVANHPSTARFISTKLARRFVSDTPPSALVDRMAATFTKTHGDLREVMRTLLTSREFLSKDIERVKVKNPFEFVVSSLRATGADVNNALPTVRAIGQLGMPLYQCQPPTGYKDSADTWVNTGALVNRMNVALTLASGRLPGVKLSAPPSADSILGLALSESTRSTMARATTNEQSLALALGSPEFQRR